MSSSFRSAIPQASVRIHPFCYTCLLYW